MSGLGTVALCESACAIHPCVQQEAICYALDGMLEGPSSLSPVLGIKNSPSISVKTNARVDAP